MESVKVDINHDALKGWEKEKANEEKILLRSGAYFQCLISNLFVLIILIG